MTMSATKFQAMLRAGGVSGTGKRELKKHLSAHLGKGFCPTRRSINMLAEGHCEVYSGSVEFTTMEKRRQSLLSGPRRISTTKSQSTYSGI